MREIRLYARRELRIHSPPVRCWRDRTTDAATRIQSTYGPDAALPPPRPPDLARSRCCRLAGSFGVSIGLTAFERRLTAVESSVAPSATAEDFSRQTAVSVGDRQANRPPGYEGRCTSSSRRNGTTQPAAGGRIPVERCAWGTPATRVVDLPRACRPRRCVPAPVLSRAGVSRARCPRKCCRCARGAR